MVIVKWLLSEVLFWSVLLVGLGTLGGCKDGPEVVTYEVKENQEKPEVVNEVERKPVTYATTQVVEVVPVGETTVVRVPDESTLMTKEFFEEQFKLIRGERAEVDEGVGDDSGDAGQGAR